MIFCYFFVYVLWQFVVKLNILQIRLFVIQISIVSIVGYIIEKQNIECLIIYQIYFLYFEEEQKEFYCSIVCLYYKVVFVVKYVNYC